MESMRKIYHWCPRRKDWVKSLLPRPMVQMNLFGPNFDPEEEHAKEIRELLGRG